MTEEKGEAEAEEKVELVSVGAVTQDAGLLYGMAEEKAGLLHQTIVQEEAGLCIKLQEGKAAGKWSCRTVAGSTCAVRWTVAQTA